MSEPKHRPHANIDVNKAAKVTLGGEVFYVPVPPLRWSMELVDLGDKIASWGDKPWKKEEYEVAMQAVHYGLRTAYPDLTLEQLFDMSIALDEVIAAVPVVLSQTRAFRLVKPGEEPGEGSAASR